MGAVLFGFFGLELLITINLLLITLGLSVVILLDRNIPHSTHIMSVYVFILSFMCLITGVLSLFSPSLPVYVFFLLFSLSGLYIFFPSALEKAHIKKHISPLSWHFSNFILGISWAIFLYLFWSLFW